MSASGAGQLARISWLFHHEIGHERKAKFLPKFIGAQTSRRRSVANLSAATLYIPAAQFSCNGARSFSPLRRAIKQGDQALADKIDRTLLCSMAVSV